MAKEKIGSGRRFRVLAGKLAGKAGVKNPAALAAAIGRKKFGKERFNKLAEAGRRREVTPEEKQAGSRRVRL